MPLRPSPAVSRLGVATLILPLVLIAPRAAAQASVDAHAENELWPSAVVTAPVGARIDVGAALRMKLREPSGDARERAVGATASLTSHGVRVALAAERLTHWSRDDGEPSTTEHRVTLDATHDLLRASRVRLWQRSRVESRDFGERHAYRMGDRLQLELRHRTSDERRTPDEHALRSRLTPYLSLESSYDTRYHTVNRVLGYAGTRAGLHACCAVDVQGFGLHDSRGAVRWTRGVAVALRVNARIRD